MWRILLGFIVFIHQPTLAAETYCGDPFNNGSIAPYDYNDHEARSNPSKIPIIEQAHFTRKVELLIEGQSMTDPGGDIDYVLRAVPNHHRALYAFSKYALRTGNKTTRWLTAECYFERALQFRPEDAVVYMLYGLHYAMRDQHEMAIRYYRTAEEKMPNSPELSYNLGLSLVAVGKYEEARLAAEKAYEGGYPLPGLRAKLKRLGYDL